jgi:hypothetical protein
MTEDRYIPPSSITKGNVKLFPFTMSLEAGRTLFTSYAMTNRTELDEKHGTKYFTGNAEYDKKPRFLWNDVDVILQSPTTAKFTVYDSAGSLTTERGEVMLTRYAEFDLDVLAPHIEKEQLRLAEQVLDARAAEAARLQRNRDIQRVREELFGIKVDESLPA